MGMGYLRLLYAVASRRCRIRTESYIFAIPAYLQCKPQLQAMLSAVQSLAATLMKTPDGERKKAWKEELALLQKELNRTTEIVMAGFGQAPPGPGWSPLHT